MSKKILETGKKKDRNHTAIKSTGVETCGRDRAGLPLLRRVWGLAGKTGMAGGWTQLDTSSLVSYIWVGMT